jgi:3-hydroxyisobutyrate dehydrogenase-like beta-hydroxyacid dehydrogenase
MTTVGVVGLGTMGSRIARRLLDAGYGLVVWNRSPDKAAPLVDLGASAAQTPAEATRRTDVAITMVSDPRALKDVTEGPDGVAAGAGASSTVIQMSTVGIEPVQRLASILPAETGLLDAPVLGSIAEVESGSLRIFVGGPPVLVERWTPLLSVLGSPIHVGGLGAGSAAKLVANSTLFGVLGVLGEALLLARALGLPDDVAFEVLAATPLAAQAKRRRPSVETGEYPNRFSLFLARKDAGLVTAAGANLRLAEAALAWLEEAEAAGLGELDYSALLGYMLGDSITS